MPKPWREQVMRILHQISHGGQKDTIAKVSNAYYWPKMRQDVSEFVKQCQDCQAVKSYKTIRPPQSNIAVPDQRFSSVQVDIVGPLPPSEGYRYLLTVWDRTSRWLEALPLMEANAKNCCLAFINGWIQRFGLPKIVTSDNGNTFVAQLWQGLHQHLGIKVEYTPPYHPSSLGGVERKHRDLKASLKASLHQLADTEGSEWVSRLPWVPRFPMMRRWADLTVTSALLFALG